MFISVLTLLAFSAIGLCRESEFAKTCSQIGVSDGELYATCRREDKSNQSSELNLDGCIGNNNGNLVCGETK